MTFLLSRIALAQGSTARRSLDISSGLANIAQNDIIVSDLRPGQVRACPKKAGPKVASNRRTPYTKSQKIPMSS